MSHEGTFLRVACTLALALFGRTAPNGDRSHRDGQSIPYFDTTYYVLEGENFTTCTLAANTTAGWSPKVWGKDPNYFASVCYNTFMSRRAYLHGPSEATTGNATATLNIAGAGEYAVLVRYEGLATHDANFRVVIEQGGTVKYDRIYGRLTNWKMWSFAGSRVGGAVNRGGLNGTACGAEGPYALAQACMWNYGASENMLYEGAGNSTVGHPPARLDVGPATITLSLDSVYSASDLLHRADRNLDLVMLTSNLTDVQKRVANDTQGPLSLDGLISQHGELFMRAKNTGDRDLTLVVPQTTASSPDDYQQPIRFPIPSPNDPNTMVSGCTFHGSKGPCAGCRCPRVELPAIDQGDWSLWREVGSLMDTFMPGVWTICNETMPGENGTPLNQSGASFSVQFGVRNAPALHPTMEHSLVANGDEITIITERTTAGVSMQFNFDPNTIGTHLMNKPNDDLIAIMGALDAQTPTLSGNAPTVFPIYANAYGSAEGNAVQRWYDPSSDVPLFSASGKGQLGPTVPSCSILENTSNNKAMTARFQSMIKQQPDYPKLVTDNPRSLIYMRGPFYDPALQAGLAANGTVPQVIYDKYLSPTKHLCRNCTTTAFKERIVDPESVLAVDIGDEFTFPYPDPPGIPAAVIDPLFVRWLKGKMNLSSPAEAGCTSWATCHYQPRVQTMPLQVTGRSASLLWYLSGRFARDWGLEEFKNITAPMQAAWPNAGIGFNQPTPYTSVRTCAPVHQWIRSYREGVMSLPWTEDWSWATPLGTQQMQQLALDAFRSGMRDRNLKPNSKGVWSGAAPIHSYVMPHTPGNTGTSWRRQFYADLNHGLKQLNLFGFEPLVQIQGPNAVDTWDDMDMYLTVRKTLSELGMMEDIVLHGTAQAFGADVALLMSESSDIMADYTTPATLLGRTGTAGTAQRALYVALRHLQQPVDVIIEEDCEDPDGILRNYSSVFISDPNLKESAARGLSTWVKGNSKRTIWTSAGSMLNELNVTNLLMLELFGLSSYTVRNHTNMIQFIKQDLAFAPLLDQVTLLTESNAFGVYGTRARLELNRSASGTKVLATFSDSSPAVISRSQGSGGRAILCGFHPSLSYFHKAIPPLPTARGATDESFNHMCPRDFDTSAKSVVAMGLSSALRPPPTRASALDRHERNLEGLIETGVVTAPGKGTIIPIVDWSGERSTHNVRVDLARPIEFQAATLASGGTVEVSNDKKSLTVVELQIADAIILR